MQAEAAEGRRKLGRGKRGERRTELWERNSGEERRRLKEIIVGPHQKENQCGNGEEDKERGRKREGLMGNVGRRAESEGSGGEEWRNLRRRINELEKGKLKLTSAHNQEVCGLQTELTRLRSLVEWGEAQREELQYELAVSRRDAERAAELSRDKLTLTERVQELQHANEELQKSLSITRRAREEDQRALQQELKERDKLIQRFSSENQRLHRLLQDQEEALKESDRRRSELQKEVEENRRRNEELLERQERSLREKELLDRRLASLQSNIEVERATHLETKFNSEIVQLRVCDLEAALAVERSGQQEAQHSLELLKVQFREVERVYREERERSSNAEHALERLQTEYEQCKSDMSVALETKRKMTSELSRKFEDEKKHHMRTQSLLEEAVQRQHDMEDAFVKFMNRIRETLQQHARPGKHSQQPAKDDGKLSPPAEVLQLLESDLGCYQHKLEQADKQTRDLLQSSEELRKENQVLQGKISDQSNQIKEFRQASLRLEEEAARLRTESSDWSTRSQSLQDELLKEKQEKLAEVQKITEHYNNQSTARLSSLYCLYQRLLAGCVLLKEPQSILGNFTWEELCDVIGEQVDQLTSDLRRANEKVAHVQSMCNSKSEHVRELERSQKDVLFRLEESVKRREEEWKRRHESIVKELENELQLCLAQCDSLRDRVSSLELHSSSLTSRLSRLRGLLSGSRKELSSSSLACSLLVGVLRHFHRCLRSLSEQKTLLSRRLEEREQLEEGVRRLTDALGNEKEEKEGEVVRRWRRSVCAVLAVRRWRSLAKKTTVLFRLERGDGAPAVSVCGEEAMDTQKDKEDKSREDLCARWLRSKRLSSAVLSSMSDLQEALSKCGSTPPLLVSAAQSALSRLLDQLFDQSTSSLGSGSAKEETARLGFKKRMPSQPDTKTLVSALQQHFLLFSQRLHSAEVERRGLRLEVASLKRGLQEGTVPTERFDTVCSELHQALGREQEAQSLIQEQSNQLRELQCRVDAYTVEHTDAKHTLSRTTQSLMEARQEVSRKDRSLRILGKHLSKLHREKKQLEDELKDAARRQECVIGCIKSAEMSCKQRWSCPITALSVNQAPPPAITPGKTGAEGSGEHHGSS
ncbi:uncharacterized protein ccdc171 isoform 2-T2 [Pholidichthys leucotaenia]